MKNLADENILQFLKHLRTDPKTRYTLMADGIEPSSKDVLKTINKFYKKKLYDMIVFIIVNAGNCHEVDDALEKFIYEILIEMWELKGSCTMIQQFKKILKKEIKLSVQKKKSKEHNRANEESADLFARV